MKINEIEELVGITKRNIRYYEKEGLLSPRRNSENGYRDYGDGDVDTLKKIKLLRKLNVPLEEIRRMQQGVLTLDDGLHRHIIQIAREQENLSTMKALCETLLRAGEQLPTLDAGHYLTQMDQMEQEGTRFMNIKKHDTMTRYAGPILAAVLFIALAAGLAALYLWATLTYPDDAPPPFLTFLIIAMVASVICGILIALRQRIKQIQGGEEDAAAQY